MANDPTHGLIRLALVLGALTAVNSADAQVPASPQTTEDRIRVLEQQNRELQQKLDLILGQLKIAPPAAAPGSAKAATVPDPGPTAPQPAGNAPPVSPGNLIEPSSGSVSPATPRGGAERGESARVDLEHGLRVTSPDDRFRVEFHNLSQFDGRLFSATGNGPNALHDNFDIPRQRLYFSGQVDKSFEFYSVLNRGYGSFDVLDAYVNFKFDKAFNIRAGRTKTPYTYEYYKIAEGDLVAPERSVFVGNLSANRQDGVMSYGQLLDERVEYATGLFNGPHRSFQDYNNYKNPFFFLNTKPFLRGNNDLLRHLNVGGWVNFGQEDDPLEPAVLQTANDETNASAINNLSPTFLRFNPNAREFGRTAFWSGDVTWFYRNLTMLSNYTGGYITYAQPGRPLTEVPYRGGSVALTYFLTGEEITTRKDVEPRLPFKLRNPLANPGAIEPYARLSYLQAGTEVFTSGLADPAENSNAATVLDLGVNWYLNRYVRIFLDWQHAEFGSPVSLGPGKFVRSTNLFWLRTQMYY